MKAYKPILFSTEMVRAIMGGRKTQTRRVIKPQPNADGLSKYKDSNMYKDVNGHLYKTPYAPCMVLWVRETWTSINELQRFYGVERSTVDRYLYKADDPEFVQIKWKPSIFMPREACRIFLEITNVRVERLHDITWQDCQKEGITFLNKPHEKTGSGFIDNWITLWDSINAKRGYPWANNPWIWVIEFERIQ